jgi:DNA invertase Pin-like site-specific DNA recombinase
MSTDEQIDSPEVQAQLIEAYAAKESHTIVMRYADLGESGGMALHDRPGARQMLEDARAGLFQGIVSLRQDRLGRDKIDLEIFRRQARKAKLSLLFVTQQFTDDPYGDFVWSTLANVGELERKLTGVRVKEHNRWRAQKGLWPSGRPPLGFKWSAEHGFQIDADRQADVMAIFETFIDCCGNRNQATRAIQRLGIRTQTGRLFNQVGLSRIICNPLYAGVLKYAGERTEIEGIPEVVPRSLVAHAQQLFVATTRRKLKHTKHTYAYSSFLVCALCGSKMTGHSSGMYICAGKTRATCDARAIGTKRLDRMMGQALQQLLREHIRNADVTESKPKITVVKPRNVQADRNRWLDLYAANAITREELMERLQSCKDEPPRKEPQKMVIPAGMIDSTMESFPSWWIARNPMDMRKLLLMCVSRIVVSGGVKAFISVESPHVSNPIVIEDTINHW